MTTIESPMRIRLGSNPPAKIQYVPHASFEESGAEKLYAFEPDEEGRKLHRLNFMPDEVTRDYAMKMHYCGYRHEHAATAVSKAKWRANYLQLRDLVILGNRKLIYKAVRKQMAFAHRSDDMVGECSIVMIRAVAAYNPWLGIRFSTYAFTCLMRALARLSHRYSSDWLTKSLDLDSLADTHLHDASLQSDEDERFSFLSEYLQESHPLLSMREKMILRLRFYPPPHQDSRTLEKVGQELGLSKERVRQVQVMALDKLRNALAAIVGENH